MENLQNQVETTEVAEEATLSEENSVDAEQNETVNNVAEEAKTSERDRERDAIYADARRRAEAEFRKKEEALNARVVRNFGNYEKDGHKITNAYELMDAYEAEQIAAQRQALVNNGVDTNVIDNYVNNLPVVREAQAFMEAQKVSEAQRAMDADFAEIQKFDSSLKSIKDIPQSVVDRVVKSNGAISLLDSYKIENFGVINSKKAEALQQKAINDMRGKGHLNPVNGSVEPDTGRDLSESELKTMQRFYPGLSYEELKKKVNSVT